MFSKSFYSGEFILDFHGKSSKNVHYKVDFCLSFPPNQLITNFLLVDKKVKKQWLSENFIFL